MFRCAEDRQAVRSGDRHASLSRNDFPYSVVRLETDHSAVPICQHVSRRAQRWSRRAAGPRTAVRLVLDGSEHADTLSHIRGCQNQHPALDRQHGIYRDTTDDVSKALGDIKTGDECPSQEQHGGGLLIGHVVSGIQVA